jgi:hypothetical protein
VSKFEWSLHPHQMSSEDNETTIVNRLKLFFADHIYSIKQYCHQEWLPTLFSSNFINNNENWCCNGYNSTSFNDCFLLLVHVHSLPYKRMVGHSYHTTLPPSTPLNFDDSLSTLIVYPHNSCLIASLVFPTKCTTSYFSFCS